MSDASVSTYGNLAKIMIPVDALITVRAVVNSPNSQAVKVRNEDSSVGCQFTGTSATGEEKFIGQATFLGPQELVASFEYRENSGAPKPSMTLRTHGPGPNDDEEQIVVVADNNDGKDNRGEGACIVFFTWPAAKE